MDKMIESTYLEVKEKNRRIDQLKDKLKDDETLRKFPHVDDAYLERFLGGTCFDVDEAFNRMKTFYELLLEFPEWFTKDPPRIKKHVIEKEIRIALPETDKEGRPIYVVKLGNCDPTTMDILDVVAVDDIWMESILLNFPAERGLCVLVDIANLPLRILKWFTPHNIKTAVKRIQCMPFKDYRFHVVNNHMLVKPGLKLMWPFLPNSLKEMIKFHFNDRKSLHEFIDPQILPPEYGGRNYEINYDHIVKQLFDKNEIIFDNFRAYREVQLVP